MGVLKKNFSVEIFFSAGQERGLEPKGKGVGVVANVPNQQNGRNAKGNTLSLVEIALVLAGG